jgi:chemotaxis protein MotA
LLSALKNAFIPVKIDQIALVGRFIALSEQARREGILSLENGLFQINDEFFRRGLQLAVDGTDPAIIRALLESELDQIEQRHHKGSQVLEDLAAIAPAFGMIGTLIGLVLMLANMSDPDTIGPAMAVALITTFYGALIANLFCLPLAIKLRGYSAKEIQAKTMIMEGVMALQSGENPRLMEWKMLTYLAPDDRIKVREAREKEAKRG